MTCVRGPTDDDSPSRQDPHATPSAANGLRIVHVTADLRTRWSGLRTALLGLGRAQRELGCDVAAQCIDEPVAGEDGLPSGGGVFPIAASRAVRYMPGHFSPSMERWAASPRAADFDLLHQHGIWTAMSRVTAQWRTTHRRPTVISPHGSLEPIALQYSTWKKAIAWGWYERENLARASCLHATADAEVDGFRDLGLRNPVAVITNGGPEPGTLSAGNAIRFLAAHRIPDGSRIILFLSRIHPKKGLRDIIDAMALLGHVLGPWHLVIAGPEEDVSYCAAVRDLVGRRHLTARVHWAGPVFDSDKRDALAAAEILVLPTLSDNFAFVVAEALSAGVPVLATRAALPWHVLEPHACGWWVAPGVAALAQALGLATALPSQTLAAMGRRGIALVCEDFRWSDAATRTVQLYRWLLGDAQRPGFVVIN